MRSTKILSVENRMVVPNSQIGKEQVVNYSYPDPSLFNTLNMRVAYEDDPDEVAKVSRAIIWALKEVGIVLPYQKGSLNVQVKPDGPSTDSPPNPQP